MRFVWKKDRQKCALIRIRDTCVLCVRVRVYLLSPWINVSNPQVNVNVDLFVSK